MVFMTYANVVYSYGTERFAKAAAEIGMDGLILPDVPFEEKEEFAIPFKENGLDLISLIAPTSPERIAMIAKEAEGFGISEPKQAEKMARYVKDLVLNKPEDFVTFIMNDYLQKNQFVVSEWKGEPAYRTGDALIEGYKYLKWSYENGTLHLEAWMKSTFGKEMGLDGFVGALQKKPYREGLEQLFHVLEQAIPEVGMNEMTGQQGMNGANGQPKSQPVPVKTVDNSGAATMALVFGILAFGISFLSPLISIILAILGYSRARIGMQSALKGRAKAGRNFCIVAIVLSIILWVTNLVLTIMVR